MPPFARYVSDHHLPPEGRSNPSNRRQSVPCSPGANILEFPKTSRSVRTNKGLRARFVLLHSFPPINLCCGRRSEFLFEFRNCPESALTAISELIGQVIEDIDQPLTRKGGDKCKCQVVKTSGGELFRCPRIRGEEIPQVAGIRC